jgi:hypothetical protein
MPEVVFGVNGKIHGDTNPKRKRGRISRNNNPKRKRGRISLVRLERNGLQPPESHRR